MKELAEVLIRVKKENKSFDYGILEDDVLLSDVNSLQATLEGLESDLFVECMTTIFKNLV